MIQNRSFKPTARVLAVLACTWLAVRADEGMWLFNAPPASCSRRGMASPSPTPWLLHLQKSRSGSTAEGRAPSSRKTARDVNHHVGRMRFQKLGDEKHNYLRDGFHARTLAEEKPCHDSSSTC